MFEYTIPEVKEAIEQEVRDIPSMISCVKFDVGPQSSAHVVNKLVVSIGSKKYFVSEYLARHLSTIASEDIIGLLNDSVLTEDNPVMDGWALEADFLYSLNSSKIERRIYDIIFNAQDGPALGGLNETYVTAGPVIKFYRNVPDNLIVDQIRPNQWLVPEVHNQGGFDCVQVVLVLGVLILRH